jgi:hypothetical protein
MKRGLGRSWADIRLHTAIFFISILECCFTDPISPGTRARFDYGSTDAEPRRDDARSSASEAGVQVPCVPVQLRLDIREVALPGEKEPYREALCAVDRLRCSGDDDSATMSYCFDCDYKEGWMVCNFGQPQDMTRFDLGYTGEGALAINFCLEGTLMTGELNLWYGTHPNRRKIPLKAVGEQLAPGCYTRLIAPEDVCTPGYSDAACKTNACGKAAAVCRVPGLDKAFIAVAAESACSAPSQGTVRLRSVTYYPPECLCLPSRTCPGDSACSLGDGHGLPSAACSGEKRCTGVCMTSAEACEDAAWQGLACEVTFGARTCAGALRCVDGAPFCDAAGCMR